MRYDAIYARQSVDKEDSISIESQIEYCTYETRGGHYEVFSDKGYSGKNTDRPQFQAMLSKIRAGEIGRVICYKLDRISRSILDFTRMVEEFQEHHVEFVSCTEKFDTSTPMGRAMLNICVVFAQLERETIQQRITDAYQSRSQKGFYMGGRVPYGFSIVPCEIDGVHTSKYVVNQEEAKVVRLIYELYSEPQCSIRDIVKYLTSHSIKQDRLEDGHWSITRIGDMIRNPVYVKADYDIYEFYRSHETVIHNRPEDFIGKNGCYLYSEKGADSKTYSLKSHHLVLAPHEGIVDSDIWLRCRRKSLANSQFAKPIKARNTWLAGRIKCPKCGYAMVVRKSKTRVGRYFICSRHEDSINGCPGVGGLYAGEIEQIVFEAMAKKIFEIGISSGERSQTTNPRLEELRVRLSAIETEIKKLTDRVADANDVLMHYINDRIESLDTEKSEILSEIKKFESEDHCSENDILEVSECLGKWGELTNEDKMSVAGILISRVLADKENVTIEWKI